MKKISLFALGIVGAMAFTACSDEAYTEKYNDPSKTTTVSCDKLFTGVVWTGRTYGMQTYWGLCTFELPQIGAYSQVSSHFSADADYEEQIAEKQKYLTSLLGGFGRVEPVLAMEDPLHYRMKVEGIAPFAIPGVFVLLSYAALLPKDITELMPALKSAWFVSHISSAILSYSAFAIACFLGIRYLTMLRRGASPEDKAMQDLDYLSYRMIAFGFIFLTLVILTGCIWAEQAWSTFWSWDPKETWALITWIIYAIYQHLRINRKYRGKKMAVYVIVAMICVIFTFVGVNQLMPGLHSYG